ncbi:hypothetical protein [Henriciella aquimarina]|uniref:hypothetical protein n=1 Tax=Henriciella aquimarina TaxID=545261 RepID=UPI000A04911E|nr:hypothetical protein [Henriciella aquimarina]
MKPVIFAALAFALPAVASPASTGTDHSYSNIEVYGLTLEDQIDCDAVEPMSMQVRHAVDGMQTLTFNEAVDMFVFLQGHEGVCGQLANQASVLVSLSESDPAAFMAQLGLSNRPTGMGYGQSPEGSGQASGPSDGTFDLLKNGTPPPASSSVKTTSDYSS